MDKYSNRYKETFKIWNEVATMYEEKFMDLDLYNSTYDVFCKLIKKQNASILDIACGPGNITKYLLSKQNNFNILGIDIAKNMIKLAKKNNPTANFKIMDGRKTTHLKSKFDAIISGFYLPYLSKKDRVLFFIDVYNLLLDNGILYISFVDGAYKDSNYKYGSKGNGSKMFFYYHDLKNIKSELNKFGFETLNIIEIEYTKLETHTILIVKKQA